jgi:hypothetical protein
MQLDRQAERLGRLEDAGDLLGRKGDALAEAVDRVGELSARRWPAASSSADLGRYRRPCRRSPRAAAHGRRGRWCGRRPGASRRAAGGAQRLHLAVEVEPVAGLDLDRRDAFGDQRIEAAAERWRPEVVLARRARRLDRSRRCRRRRGRSPHSSRRLQAQLELMGPVAGIDEMGVAIDQAGRDPAALAIDRSRASPTARASPPTGAGKDDAPSRAAMTMPVLDDTPSRACPHR